MQVGSAAEAEALDALAWTYEDTSFLTHDVAGGRLSSEAHMVIAHGSEAPEGTRDLLINLCDEVPPFFARYARVVEVIDADPARRDHGRRRWTFYRERGYPLAKTDVAAPGRD